MSSRVGYVRELKGLLAIAHQIWMLLESYRHIQ